jgi:hypothetical protein
MGGVAPAAATAAGYRVNTFHTGPFSAANIDLANTGTSGFQWYLNNPFGSPATPARSVAINPDGSLTLTGTVNAFNVAGGHGVGFGGGAYFEAALSLNPAQVDVAAGAWPHSRAIDWRRCHASMMKQRELLPVDVPSMSIRFARFEDVSGILRLIERALEHGCRDVYDQRQRRSVHLGYASSLFIEALGPYETLVDHPVRHPRVLRDSPSEGTSRFAIRGYFGRTDDVPRTAQGTSEFRTLRR